MLVGKPLGLYGSDANNARIYQLLGVGHLEPSYKAPSNIYWASTQIEDAVLYPNPYMTITSKNYTKHYYAGSERIATVIGGGGLDSMVHSTSVTPTQEELTVKAGFLNHYLHHQDPFLYDGVVDTVIPTEDIRGVYDPNLQYGCPSVILDTIAMNI